MQRVSRCPCSIRALEAFVRDVAGLEIRSRRSHVSIRRLSTTPTQRFRHSSSQRLASRQLSTVRTSDEEFVPFETGVASSSRNVEPTHRGSPLTPPPNNSEVVERLESDEEELDVLVDFEPEITIHEDAVLETLESARSAAHQLEDSEPSNLNRTVDAISFPDLRFPHRVTSHRVHSQRLDIVSSNAITREERRKERKVRRTIAREQQENQEKTTAEAQKEPGKNARKKARRALEALEEHELQKTQEQDAASITAMIASATAPKIANTKKLEKAALKKAEKKAAEKKAAEEKAAAALAAQKERNKNKESWQIQKAALESKFGEQDWNPRKRISPDALAGIRALHAKSPETFSTPVLAEHFKVPPEAIRRILKSKWQPSEEEAEDRRRRWENRGVKKWTDMAEQGIRPPKKWRQRGVGKVGPGEVPPWKAQGKAGERWIQSTDADRFVVAGDSVAEEETPMYEDDGIAERIL